VYCWLVVCLPQAILVYDERRLPAGKGGSTAQLHQALKVSSAAIKLKQRKLLVV
jgi:hypothetical protein